VTDGRGEAEQIIVHYNQVGDVYTHTYMCLRGHAGVCSAAAAKQLQEQVWAEVEQTGSRTVWLLLPAAV
jgi:hypothetical protein